MRLESCKECGDKVPVAQLNMDMQCEECSQICEICSKPHYNCKDYDYDHRVCGPCLQKESQR